jgi:UTP--glucose-1-phosphate uridylyltransferase
MDIIKAVIPAAGIGSRFLPYTATIPKEMLPILNKPAIQYIIEEGLASSVNQFILITSRNKEQLADHFNPPPHLQALLDERGKKDALGDIKKIMRQAQFVYVRQPEPLGLGHAVLMARSVIGKEYFAVMLPDDLIFNPNLAGLAQLIRIARQEKGSVIAVQEVPASCVSSYGVIGIKKQISPSLFQVSHVVEKPDQKDAPSNLAIIGRYVLSSKIFNSLEEISTYASGELQLTDAIGHMIQQNEKVFAYKMQGIRYDVGTPIGWVKAILGMSLQDPAYAPHIRAFLSDIDGSGSFLYNSQKSIEHMR